MAIKHLYLILLTTIIGFLGIAQETDYNGDPDISFYIARDLAFSGKRAIAQDTLNHILTRFPHYDDVRNLLASTYSWDGKYEKARGHFNKIISTDKKNKETWVAAIKNEIYAKEYYIALGLANKALSYNEADEQLLKLRDEILKNTPGSVENQPEIPEENFKKFFVEDKVYKNRLAISNAYEIFDIAYEPMIYSSLEYKRETKLGSIIPRVNFSNRFEINGLQYELDTYPKFSKKFYAYTNYAFSNAPIYPNHRAGVEFYANLPKSLEVSVGLRYMDFKDTKANIITGSVGLYRGNYYWSLRPYITSGEDKQLGVSGTILGRKYLKDGDNYFGLLAGYGFTPDLKQLQDGGQILAETLLYVESQHLRFEYQFSGKEQPHLYRAHFGIVRQELIFSSGTFYWSLSAGFVYHVKF